AVEHARSAAALAGADPVAQSAALACEGAALGGLGDFSASLAVFQAARAVLAGVDDALGRAQAWGGIGIAKLRQGEPATAEAALRTALELRQSCGDLAGTAGLLNNLGLVQAWQGEYGAAQQSYA